MQSPESSVRPVDPRRRRRLAALIAVAGAPLMLVVAAATADEVTLQNDSGAGRIVCPCFVPGEHAAAWLTSLCDGTLMNVQIGWGSVLGGTPPSLEEEIHVYRAGDFPDRGVELTDGELLGPVLQDGYINVFPVEGLDLDVEADETIVVSLELARASVPPFGPGPVHDGDGCQDERNTVFVMPDHEWSDRCALGLTGDWIIRAVVECGPPCRADLDGNGVVDFADVLVLLTSWGPCSGCPEDLDGNGAVDFVDILVVLRDWGVCP